MPDLKYSGLLAVAAFASTLEWGVNDSGTSKKLTGAQLLAAFPQGTIGYVAVTANQGTFTALTDLTSLTLTKTLVAARRYRISGFARATSSVASDVVGLHINDVTGAADVEFNYVLLGTAGTAAGILIQAVVVPGAGSRQYKLQMERAVGTGNITMNAAATGPAWLLIEDIGI